MAYPLDPGSAADMKLMKAYSQYLPVEYTGDGKEVRWAEGKSANLEGTNWDTVKNIGTRIDVSHQGFLNHKGDKIVLRHVSAVLGKVGDEDFVEYMKAYKNHATLKGAQLARIEASTSPVETMSTHKLFVTIR